MIRRIAAIVLALHGAIHLIGFVTPWRIATLEGFAYRTTVFNGALDVRDAGARVIGLAWLGLTVGFLTAGYGVWRGTRWAVGLTGVPRRRVPGRLPAGAARDLRRHRDQRRDPSHGGMRRVRPRPRREPTRVAILPLRSRRGTRSRTGRAGAKRMGPLSFTVLFAVPPILGT